MRSHCGRAISSELSRPDPAAMSLYHGPVRPASHTARRHDRQTVDECDRRMDHGSRVAVLCQRDLIAVASGSEPSADFCQLAITSGGWSRRVKVPARVRVGAGLGLLPRCGWVRAALRACGVGEWRGLPVTPVHLGMRTRQLARCWGLDLRVAHCCLEHAGQYSGPGARRPDPRAARFYPTGQA
jgi:hypothetical protein